MNRLKILLIVLLFVSMPLSVTGSGGSGYIAEYLAHAQFTSRISKRNPVDYLNSLSTRYKKVYFFTDIRGCDECDIEHQWWYKGNMMSSVTGETTSDRYRWWTSKTLTKNYLGDWTVKVFVDDDQVYSRTLRYYKPTKKQALKAPVQKRLKIEQMDDCELQLRYFSDKAKKDPADPYFEFMLKKWGNRCISE